MSAPAVQKHAQRRPRSRRILKRGFGLLAVVILAFGGYVGYRIYDTLSEVHSISTPPPQIDADVLGGTPGTAIDSGPALTAIATYSVKESNQIQPIATEFTKPALSRVDLAAPVSRSLMRQEGAGDPVAVPSTVRTFLLMGVDARPGEAIDVGIRPDSLSVAAYDTATNTCRLLSIPRDSRVELPGYGMSKINHALAVGGIPYEKLVVEQFLGFTIDHYALIDFSGVTTAIDAIGGIDLVVTDDAFEIQGYTFEPGPVHLDGEHALAYARFRGGPDGDFGRIRRQQQVIRAALDKLSSTSATGMATLVPSMMDSLKDHIWTDLGVGELTDLSANVVEHCASGEGMVETIMGTDQTLYDELSQMELSFMVVDDADRDRKVQWLLTGSDPTGFMPGSDTSRWAPVTTDTLRDAYSDARRGRSWTSPA